LARFIVGLVVGLLLFSPSGCGSTTTNTSGGERPQTPNWHDLEELLKDSNKTLQSSTASCRITFETKTAEKKTVLYQTTFELVTYSGITEYLPPFKIHSRYSSSSGAQKEFFSIGDQKSYKTWSKTSADQIEWKVEEKQEPANFTPPTILSTKIDPVRLELLGEEMVGGETCQVLSFVFSPTTLKVEFTPDPLLRPKAAGVKSG